MHCPSSHSGRTSVRRMAVPAKPCRPSVRARPQCRPAVTNHRADRRGWDRHRQPRQGGAAPASSPGTLQATCHSSGNAMSVKPVSVHRR
jgi:hypothetical protein